VKLSRQLLDVCFCQSPLSIEHRRRNAVGPKDVFEIYLLQVVLVHQEQNHFNRGHIWNGKVRFFVLVNQHHQQFCNLFFFRGQVLFLAKLEQFLNASVIFMVGADDLGLKTD